MGWYIDYWYVVLVVPAIILSLIAQISVKTTYSRYSRMASSSGLTGAQAAMSVLRNHGVFDVSVGQIAGTLTDNFDPRKKHISLSQGVYDSSSVAALGVACHEAGHAVQYAEGYTPIKIRNTILPVANFGSGLSVPLIFVGFLFNWGILVDIGIALFMFVVLFQLVTLPVEFDASRRAVKSLESSGMLSSEELSGTKKVLRAAAMTYVAAFAVSLAQLLRLILIASGNNRRRD